VFAASLVRVHRVNMGGTRFSVRIAGRKGMSAVREVTIALLHLQPSDATATQLEKLLSSA
jgi:hypothetical protein